MKYIAALILLINGLLLPTSAQGAPRTQDLVPMPRMVELRGILKLTQKRSYDLKIAREEWFELLKKTVNEKGLSTAEKKAILEVAFKEFDNRVRLILNCGSMEMKSFAHAYVNSFCTWSMSMEKHSLVS